MKITIWGDFACPFCYMEEYMLENLLKERVEAGKEGVEIEFRAYQLDSEAPEIPIESMEEHFVSEHDITPEEALVRIERISKMAARAGLEYNLAGVQVCNTMDAHRLMKLAEATSDASTVLKLNFALFHANFVENRRLSDHGVLKEIAASVGLDLGEVDSMLNGEKYVDEVRADEKEADNLGLEYIPYMKFSDGQLLQGVISLGAMRKVLG